MTVLGDNVRESGSELVPKNSTRIYTKQELKRVILGIGILSDLLCKLTTPWDHSFSLAESHTQYRKRCNATPPINGELSVINLFFFIMIIFRRKQKLKATIPLHPQTNKYKCTCLVYGTRVCTFWNYFGLLEKKTNCLWRLANLFSDPQPIPDVNLLPHKIMTSRQWRRVLLTSNNN